MNCTLCNKASRIAEISKDKICMGCECDLAESLEELKEEDTEEDMEGVGVCLNCNKETILFKDKICWECYKRVLDDLQRDEERQNYNCRL